MAFNGKFVIDCVTRAFDLREGDVGVECHRPVSTATRKLDRHSKLWLRATVLWAMAVITALLTFGYESSARAQTPTGTVTVAVPSFQSESFLPSKQNISARTYYGPLLDTLIGVKPTGEVDYSFGVLEAVTPSEGGRIYTLTLKPNLRWHDGSPITPDDVKFTLDLFANNPGSSVAATALKINFEKAEVTGPNTIRVSLKNPDVLFPNLLAPVEGDMGLLPKLYIERVGLEGFDRQPIGSGPWKFAGRVLGQSVEYAANTDYWDKRRIPGFARLRIVLAADSSARKAMLRSGEVDLAPLDPADVESFRDRGFKIISTQYSALAILYFWRSWDPAFLTHKLPFRQALVRAVNVDAIAKAFYPPGTGTRATGPAPLSPASAGFNSKLPAYPYDPEGAKALLREAGYKGEEITLYSYLFPGAPEVPDLILAIAEDWKRAGVNVKIVQTDWGTFVPLQIQKKFSPPAAASIVPGQTRPSVVGNMRNSMLGPNDGGYVSSYPNPEDIPPQLAEITRTLEPEARSALIQKAGDLWFERYWALPIAWRHGAWGVSPKVASWRPGDLTCCWLFFETLQPRR